MRIAVFTSEFPSRVSTFFTRDMRVLAEAGAEVRIFPIRRLHASDWAFVPGQFREIIPPESVHHLALSGRLLPGLLADLMRCRQAGPILLSAARFGVNALIKSAYAILYGLSLARTAGGRFDHVLGYWGNYPATAALVYRDAVRRWAPFSMFLHAGVDLYRDQVFLEQKLIEATNVFVVCDFNRRFIKELYPATYPRIEEKIRVYHLGLDFDEIRFSTAAREPGSLVCVGRIVPRKGFDIAVRAVSLLASRGQEVQLKIVGDGPARRALSSLARRLGVSDRVEFVGWLAPHDVLSAIARSYLLVHPSTGLGDAVPTVIKEAMAVGTPVVASHVAGIPELLDFGRSGALVPPGDVTAMADAVARFCVDTPYWESTAHIARRFAEATFDLRRNSRMLIDTLKGSARGAPPDQTR